MSSYKRIGGNYTIESVGGYVTIVGNLIVTGNSTSVTSTNTNVTDNIITLNKGESGAGVANGTGYSGIEIDRGTQPKATLRWSEPDQKWQISSDSSSYVNIATSGTGGGLSLSANLDMLSYSIYSSTNGNVRFDDNVAIQNTTVAPSAAAGYNTVYAQTPGGGGSGLYVTNTTNTAQELATQAAAIKYSIIFG